MKVHYLNPGISEPTTEDLQLLTAGLFVKLCLAVWRDPYGAYTWRMKKADDEHHFYLGIEIKPGTQMRMEIPMIFWDKASTAKELTELPLYDGHTYLQIVERLDQYLRIYD
jgi:hypothetical protein